MRIYSKKTAAICALLLGVAGFVAVTRVSALDSNVTDEQIQRIKENCISMKTTLNQLHASDALLRVNRGQLYESMSIKLMDKFNSRAANNGMDNSELVSITSKYNTALNGFRGDYIKYEGQLSAAISTDCKKQPVSFYDAVAAANTARGKVHKDILSLNQKIDEYRAALSQFEKENLSDSKEQN